MAKSSSRKHRNGLSDFLKCITTDLQSVYNSDHREFILDAWNASDVTVDRDVEACKEVYLHMPGLLAKQRSLQLLRAKLLNHKWGDAAMILEVMADLHWKSFSGRDAQLGKHPEIFHKVGREIVLNHPLTYLNEDLLGVHMRSMGTFKETVDHIHILLEHVFSFFAKHNYHSAKDLLTTYSVIPRNIKWRKRRIKDRAYWTPVAEAYLGLIEYIFWRLLVANEPSNTFQSTDSSNTFSTNSDSNQEKIAITATNHIKNILEEPGIWDIFIVKHMEMLLHYFKFDELRLDLSLYSETHLQNPNAHKYLYHFLQSYLADKNVDVEYLKVTALLRLQNISPADGLMISLHNLLFKRCSLNFNDQSYPNWFENLYSAFETIMHLLDHPCWCDISEPWCALHRNLLLVSHSLDKETYLLLRKKLWKESGRENWWPSYHFSVVKAEALLKKENEIKQAKLFIASFLLNVDSAYCEIIKKSL